MDPQFQELAATITRDVSEAVTATVVDAVKQHVTEVLSAAEERLTTRFDAAEKRLSEQARINAEAVRSEFRLAAEGYAAAGKSIEAHLVGLRTDLDKRVQLTTTRS